MITSEELLEIRKRGGQCFETAMHPQSSLSHAGRDIERLLDEVERLNRDKEVWGNEFSAVIIIKEKIDIALKALEFYADMSHWTTEDDELVFIKVTDQDWDKSSGSIAGGGVSRKALSQIRGEQ